MIFPVSLGTGLSLIGDTSLYTVLPTHASAAGVSIASLGILLSANRFVRLGLNGPVGWASERWPRRRLFVPALLLGALSTAIYAMTRGFWPLLAGRLLWGLAWVGIWVGGNTIILDISRDDDRGRWVGIYQVSFFLGAASGAIIGGLLTDWLGYHRAMGTGAIMTMIGALYAWKALPETYTGEPPMGHIREASDRLPGSDRKIQRLTETVAAIFLLGINRFTVAGILTATLGLYLFQNLGASASVAGFDLGIASLTGAGLGGTTLIAMATVPLIGRLSDRAGSRWQVVAGGVLPGCVGFGLLSLGSLSAMVAGLALIAVASGSNTGLSTALTGDLSDRGQHGRRLGILFTVGDLASAVGPPVAYGLLPWIGLSGVYQMAALLLGVMMVVSLLLAASRRARR